MLVYCGKNREVSMEFDRRGSARILYAENLTVPASPEWDRLAVNVSATGGTITSYCVTWKMLVG